LRAGEADLGSLTVVEYVRIVAAGRDGVCVPETRIGILVNEDVPIAVEFRRRSVAE
jgi:hypothetical protein